MAWLEAHQSLATHRKLYALASALHIRRTEAAGHLLFLWFWALDNAPDGDLTGIDPYVLKLAADWPKKADAFLEGLVSAHWVDRDGDGVALHDWDNYAGRLMDRRANDRSRKSSMRRAYVDGTVAAVRARDGDRCRYCGRTVDWTDRKTPTGGTYDHVVPTGSSTIDNLVVACRRCNNSKGTRTPWDASLTLNAPPNGGCNDESNDESNDHARSSNALLDNRTKPNQQNKPNQQHHPPKPPKGGAAADDADFSLAVRAFEELCGSITKPVADQIGVKMQSGIAVEWIVAACEEAALHNGRSWSYVSTILDSWQKHGFKTRRKGQQNAGGTGRNGRSAMVDIARDFPTFTNSDVEPDLDIDGNPIERDETLDQVGREARSGEC